MHRAQSENIKTVMLTVVKFNIQERLIMYSWYPNVWFPPRGTEEAFCRWQHCVLIQWSRHSAATCQSFVEPSFVFHQDNDAKLPGYVRTIWPRRTWSPQSSDLTPVEMVLNELDHKVKEKQRTSAQHMTTPLRLFWLKTIPGDSWRWRWSRECQKSAKLSKWADILLK